MEYTETTMEIIKALAYGSSAEEVATVMGIPVDEVKKVQTFCADDIVERRRVLKEAGYYG